MRLSHLVVAGLIAMSVLAPPVFGAESNWLVLPESVKPYKAPSLRAERDARAVGYPQVVAGRALPAAATRGAERNPIGWVEIVSPGGALYLPLALVLPAATDEAAHPRNLPIGSEVLSPDRPLPSNYQPDDLIPLDARWSFSPDRTHRLRAAAARAAERMLSEARARDRVHLRVVSSYRSFETQRRLYLKKIEEDGFAQRWVAKPGCSEHQLGTALDLAGLDPTTALTPAFADTREGRWLRENAGRYGFRASYTGANEGESGYAAEPWHYRYVGTDAGAEVRDPDGRAASAGRSGAGPREARDR